MPWAWPIEKKWKLVSLQYASEEFCHFKASSISSCYKRWRCGGKYNLFLCKADLIESFDFAKGRGTPILKERGSKLQLQKAKMAMAVFMMDGVEVLWLSFGEKKYILYTTESLGSIVSCWAMCVRPWSSYAIWDVGKLQAVTLRDHLGAWAQVVIEHNWLLIFWNAPKAMLIAVQGRV